jgi:hypothetical protein
MTTENDLKRFKTATLPRLDESTQPPLTGFYCILEDSACYRKGFAGDSC